MLNYVGNTMGVYRWFDDRECDQIINYAVNHGVKNKPSIGFSAPDSVPGQLRHDDDTRSGTLYFFSHPDINKKILKHIKKVNKKCWNLDLYNIEPLQLSVYNLNDHYTWHRDQTNAGKYNPRHPNTDLVRKLSFSINLTQHGRDYSGGDLELMTDLEPKIDTHLRAKGNGTIFLSPTLHRVLPVTGGRRVSLVGWVSGPPFR